jgi:hypothetical protein
LAVSNKAVFECRPATGNDLNSGGFVTTAGGTDWSQQAAAQVTFNGTSVTATTAGVGATITLSGYTVLTTDVGNLIRIASGTNYTAGLYQIISVSTGANTWTLDRNCTSGAGSALVGRMGGAIATLVQFFADVDANTGSVGGYICYIVGTLTITTATAINGNYNVNVAGGSTASTLGGVQVIGYSSTRGDNGQFTMTTSTNSVDLLHFGSSARNVTFYNAKFTTTAGTVAYGATTTAVSSTPNKIAFVNCSWNGFKRAIYSDGPNNAGQFTGLYLYNCTVTACTTDGIVNNCLTCLHNCYIYSNTGDGVRMEASFGNARGPLLLLHSVFYGNSGNGVYNNSISSGTTDADQITIAQNCCFVSNTGDGLKINVAGSNGIPNILVQNNIFYGNANNINSTVLYGIYLGGNNAYGAAGTTNYAGSLSALPGDITLSGDPFNGRTSNDFSLNATAGAGGACRQAGFPGILQVGGTGYADIGALSPQAGAGATTIVIGRNVTTYLGEQGDF